MPSQSLYDQPAGPIRMMDERVTFGSPCDNGDVGYCTGSEYNESCAHLYGRFSEAARRGVVPSKRAQECKT